MPRLKNTATGVVVNVDEPTAALLGQGWESADKKSGAPVKRPTKAASPVKSDK